MTSKGEQYEIECEKYLRSIYGHGVVRTSLTNDGGKDIIIYTEAGKIFVECKDWSKTPIGRPVVQKLHSAIITEGAVKGIIMTTGTFTQDARNYVRMNNLPIELRTYIPQRDYTPPVYQQSYPRNHSSGYVDINPNGYRRNKPIPVVEPVKREKVNKYLKWAAISTVFAPGIGFFLLFLSEKRFAHILVGLGFIAVGIWMLIIANYEGAFWVYIISMFATIGMICMLNDGDWRVREMNRKDQ